MTSQGIGKEAVFAKSKGSNAPTQTFYLGMEPLTGYLYIYTMVNNQKKYLSLGSYASAPSAFVLYLKDDASSFGSDWTFLGNGGTINQNAYVLQNADAIGGSGWNVYEEVLGNKLNTTKTYFDKYQNIGRQEFSIIPTDIFTIQSIDYQIDELATITQIPDFFAVTYLTNTTPITQSQTTNFGTKATNSSTFTKTTGGTETIQTQAGLKIPLIGGGKIQSTTTITHAEMDGSTKSYEDSRSYNFPVLVPGNSQVKATVTVDEFNMDVPYTASLKGQTTGRVITINGVWHGVQADVIHETFELLDSESKVVSTKKIILNNSQKLNEPITF